jgi:exopolysaccharide biosynthesis protein
MPPPFSASAKHTLSPLAIVAISATAVTALLAIGLLAVGLFVRARTAEARAAEVRAAEARRVKVAQASPSNTRVIRSERPVAPAARAIQAERLASSQGAGRSEPGLSYTNVKVASEPWSIHVLKIDRSQKDLTFASAHAGNKVLGVSLLREQAAALPRELGRAIAAVNGDFYMRDNPSYAGDPRGLQIVNGELISSPDTVCVWFDPDGNPHLDEVKNDFQITWPDGRKTSVALNQQRAGPPILPPNVGILFTPTYGISTKVRASRELILEKDGEGPWLPLQIGETYRARVREISTNGNARVAANTMVFTLPPQPTGLPDPAPGAVLQISTATIPDLKGVKAAIGGGPAIIQNGNAFSVMTPPPAVARDYAQRSKYERHPRSAVGWSPSHVYFVTVDGRQPGLSVGMKLAELAHFMAGLGCTEAMNLDGGKSAQLWFNGRLLNSAQMGEDTVANSLLVVRKPQAL